MTQHYTLYGSEFSLFTMKLDAALRFYGADYRLKRKTPDIAQNIESRSGTHQVPVLLTPENWMLGDTTPILQLLDGRFPGREMFPGGSGEGRAALGILTQIVEEYFDEWVARTMVHYRWHYEESAVFASRAMTGGDASAAALIRAWGPRACRATGTDSKHQQEQAEAEYMRIMQAIESQLQSTPYLLGSRPSAVDCIVLGGLRAHTNKDPDPKRAIAKYEAVIQWSEKTADQWDGQGEWTAFPESTPFVNFVLGEMRNTYAPFILGNAAAYDAKAKAFHTEIYGEDVSYLCRAYPETSRRMIRDKIDNESDEKGQIRAWLREQELDACFTWFGGR